MIPNVNYLPFACELVAVKNLTSLEKLFRFIRVDGQEFNQQPGQFMQLSIAGIGEAPISVSSSPTRGRFLEFGIRNTGAVTKALHELQIGAKIGMRGPFGTSFPIKQIQDKNLLLIAGGCGLAPLRSLIQYVEDHRREFKEVTILYGAKTSADLMYRDEIEIWQKTSNLKCLVTIDNSSNDAWCGNVGLITTLIPPLEFNPKNTIAVICGPPIMYKFVIVELKKKGLAEKNIVVSLERHMKCGVGKCGHCTIEHLYCCLNGPVFWLNQISSIRGAL